MSERADTAADTPASLAKDYASNAFAVASENVKETLDEKVQDGASYLDSVAGALRRAATDLSKNAPLASEVAGFCADRLEDYAGQIEGKSATDLLDEAKDFARRQPVLVVAAAAAAGFLAFRAFKNARPMEGDAADEEEAADEEDVHA